MDFLCHGNHSLLSIILSICCFKGRLWAQTQALLLISQHFQFRQLSSRALKKISKIIPRQLQACYSFTVSMEMLEMEANLTSSLISWTLLLMPFVDGSWQFTKPFLTFILVNPHKKPAWEILLPMISILRNRSLGKINSSMEVYTVYTIFFGYKTHHPQIWGERRGASYSPNVAQLAFPSFL